MCNSVLEQVQLEVTENRSFESSNFDPWFSPNGQIRLTMCVYYSVSSCVLWTYLCIICHAFMILHVVTAMCIIFL